MDTYEKKYNEAFEKAKKEYNGAIGSHSDVAEAVVNILQGIFPQLRESEDERIRRAIYDFFHLAGTAYELCGIPKANLLAWLEKQKEQKHAEWSEEDEDMLNCCISSIEEAKENRYAYKETDGDTSYDHEIAWLKSLRPSWKPSEEQMRALDKAIPVCAGVAGKDEISPLISLYEQLKKL